MSSKSLIEKLEDRRLFASVPAGFTDSTFADGLNDPTAMEFAPDGRLFVAQQTGDLRVIKNGQLLAQPFLHVDVDSDGERGLLGVTFDPDFATNSLVYIYYTVPDGNPHNRISRFTANGDTAVPGSEQVLLDIEPLNTSASHNGGSLHFGPDGKLYVAVGENRVGPLAQSLQSTKGKILRLNSDGTIPQDNPLLSQTTGANQTIWALGLRNPFTFGFRPSDGKMLINDVGESTFEEINVGSAGANYGWPDTEGPTSNPAFVTPLLSYGRSTGIAITGGVFYESQAAGAFPSRFNGKYFFADLGAGFIRSMDASTGAFDPFATGLNQPVDLDVGPDGSLYYLARGSNSIGKIAAAPNTAPTATIVSPKAGTLYRVGTKYSFSGKAADKEDRKVPASAFSWTVAFLHDGIIDAPIATVNGKTSGKFTIPAAATHTSNALFRVSLTVSDRDGKSTTTTRDILPRLVQLTVATKAAGLAVKVDGQTVASPFSFTSVAGVRHTLEALTPQSNDTTDFIFSKWSTGSKKTAIELATPDKARVVTATFKSRPKTA